MKSIRPYYWQQNYPEGARPTFEQCWWVQRWMELTDAKTSYWHSAPLTNIPSLLTEIMDWSPYIGNTFNGRTLFFLLSEFEYHIRFDEALVKITSFYNDLRDEVNAVLGELNHYYNKIGNPGTIGKTGREHIIELHRSLCELSSPQPFLKQLDALLKSNHLFYLAQNAKLIGEVLSLRELEKLNFFTKNLIVELVRNGYTIAHLNQRCKEIFLRPSPHSFTDRLVYFFDDLVVTPPTFDVYMRVQGKKALRDVGRIGQVDFLPQVGKMVNLLATDMSLEGSQEAHALRFFQIEPRNHRQVFAKVSDIKVEDYGKAALRALHELDQAIRQAKFEFEIGGFNLDNRIYVHDKTAKKLFYFTKRQAQSRYGIGGKSTKLKQLLLELEDAQNNSDLPKILIDKVLSSALHWHRSGVESIALETKFVNHWIGLEQILTSVTTDFMSKRTPGDKLVLALSVALLQHGESRPLLDLWGDMVRCGFFGPPRLLASYAGRTQFNQALSDIIDYKYAQPIMIDNERFYELVRFHSERPKISILDKTKVRQTVNVQPDTILYVADGENVYAGQWLGGACLWQSDYNLAAQKLFYELSPNLTNVWYLVYSSRYQERELADFADALSTKDLLSELPLTPQNTLRALHAFTELEDIIRHMASNEINNTEFIKREVSNRFNELMQKKNVFMQGRLQRLVNECDLMIIAFDIYEWLKLITRDFMAFHTKEDEKRFSLPTHLIKELYRHQTPKYDTLNKVVKEHSADLAKLCDEQPLLKQRIRDYGNKLPATPPFDYYLWQADRIKRVRNELVHKGHTEHPTLELLTLRLYQYSRIYLKEIIYRMGLSEKFIRRMGSSEGIKYRLCLEQEIVQSFVDGTL